MAPVFLRATTRLLLLASSWWWYVVPLVAGTVPTASPRRFPFLHPYPLHSPGMVANCTESYFEEQRIDHFAPIAPSALHNRTTYRQRYFINDDYHAPGGPMFFYLGNEADVTLYVNATGLMWENAAPFGALLVFAEHRYYGKSQPFPRNDDDDLPLSELRYLSAEQALADYAALVGHLKKAHGFAETDAVVGFGGSYGGMLASWGRMKYPHVWDGAIAASAPIASFEGMVPPVNPDFFAEGVTYDVTVEAGVASPFCERNLRKLFAGRALTEVDPGLVRSAFAICGDDNTTDGAVGWRVTEWMDEALSYMAMGNFPYPSGYILNGDGFLPSFPVRLACESLSRDMTGEDRVEEWLAGLASFASVYYNYTGKLECNSLSAPVNKESRIVGRLWDYQYCSEIFQVFGRSNDDGDMFWDDPWDGDAAAEACFDRHGFWPDRSHFPLMYGSKPEWARVASNIVWSQGEYDPWRGGGVTEDLNDSAVAVVISEAAHHLDLFFSHENDTDAVVEARRVEMEHVRKWVDEKKKQQQQQQLRRPVVREQQTTAAAKSSSNSRFWSVLPVAEALSPPVAEKLGSRRFYCSAAAATEPATAPASPIADAADRSCRGTRKAHRNSSSSRRAGFPPSVLFSSSPENDDDSSIGDGSVPDHPWAKVDFGSLELLALAVAAFFVATVALVGGDTLFVKPTLPSSPRVTLDADAVLREDFERNSGSVMF